MSCETVLVTSTVNVTAQGIIKSLNLTNEEKAYMLDMLMIAGVIILLNRIHLSKSIENPSSTSTDTGRSEDQNSLALTKGLRDLLRETIF
jgi:hypothetical protein